MSQKTLDIYKYSFRAFRGALDSIESVKARIIQLRIDGLSPVSINTYLRHVKSFYLWQEREFKLKPLKEEQKLLITFSTEHVSRIVNGKPIRRNETRSRMAALTALETGMRIQELLDLRRSDVDLDNLLLRVHGKGNKHRLVPMSIELRKLLFRYLSQHKFDRVFCVEGGTEMGQRNLSRDFKLFCSRLGITGVRVSFHTLRHTFAVEYLRAGGNVLYLQRILGHTSLEMTNRYCRSLGIDDLKAVHSGLSLLSR